MKYELESKNLSIFLQNANVCHVVKKMGILVFMAKTVLFSTDPYKTLYICYKCIGLSLNGLFKRNAAIFVFDLRYIALNIYEIWLRLLWGEHILYIRAKTTSFFNIR